MTGNNFENAEKFNKLFYRSIPKNTNEDIIAEWKKLRGNHYVSYVKDFPQEDQNYIKYAKIKHHMTKTIAYKIGLLLCHSHIELRLRLRLKLILRLY